MGDTRCRNCSLFIEGDPIPKIESSKPYFIRLDYVSKTQPNSFMVDGMPVLDRLYGKNKALQKGDTITYRVVMSDGGSTGFTICPATYDDFEVTVNGNLVTLKVKGNYQSAMFEIESVDKNGNTTWGEVRFNTILMYDSALADSGILLRDYAIRQGMKWCTASDGTMEWTPEKEYEVTIGDREDGDWYSETLAAIDSLVKIGCTKFSYQLVYPYGFQIGGYK